MFEKRPTYNIEIDDEVLNTNVVPFSEYNIELDGEVLNTIVVPFSEEEVDLLRTAWKIKESWVEEVARTSGLHRDLYTDLAIPRGYGLSDRKKAALVARDSVKEINALLARPIKSEELKSMEDELETIAVSLVSVFSRKPEKK